MHDANNFPIWEMSWNSPKALPLSVQNYLPPDNCNNRLMNLNLSLNTIENSTFQAVAPEKLSNSKTTKFPRNPKSKINRSKFSQKSKISNIFKSGKENCKKREKLEKGKTKGQVNLTPSSDPLSLTELKELSTKYLSDESFQPVSTVTFNCDHSPMTCCKCGSDLVQQGTTSEQRNTSNREVFVENAWKDVKLLSKATHENLADYATADTADVSTPSQLADKNWAEPQMETFDILRTFITGF